MGHADMLIKIKSGGGDVFEYMLAGEEYVSDNQAIKAALSRHDELINAAKEEVPEHLRAEAGIDGSVISVEICEYEVPMPL